MTEDRSPAARIAAARTFLFVPGDRPERFDKALASGADIVIVDLEDAVAPATKKVARDAVAAWLATGKEAVVRINAAGSPWFEPDLELSRLPGFLGLMLPKAEPGLALDHVADLAPVIALIESAAGVSRLLDIVSRPAVVRLAFGTIDLALDLDTSSEDLILALGIQLVVASRTCGKASPIDGVTVSFDDPHVVEQAMRQARTRGFGAKLCIHPAQLTPVRDALMPSVEALNEARRIVEADRASSGAAFAINGRMVDRPVVARAYRTLNDAGIAASESLVWKAG